jgi:hypothetical protein
MFDLDDLLETAYPELERRIKEGEYVSGLQLAIALKANREKLLPDLLFDYLCCGSESAGFLWRRKNGPAADIQSE